MASKLPAGLGECWKRVVYLDHRGEVYFVVYEEKEDPKGPEEVVHVALVGWPPRSPSEAASALA
jgi:hypothetical protein